jgi:hypothetical protein
MEDPNVPTPAYIGNAEIRAGRAVLRGSCVDVEALKPTGNVRVVADSRVSVTRRGGHRHGRGA